MIYYFLRHVFTGKHYYKCTWNIFAGDDEVALLQECRFCSKTNTNTKKEMRRIADEMLDKQMVKMISAGFSTSYTP